MSNAEDLLPSVPFTYFGICKTCHSQFLSDECQLTKGCRTFLSVRHPFPSPLFYKIKSLKSTFSVYFFTSSSPSNTRSAPDAIASISNSPRICTYRRNPFAIPFKLRNQIFIVDHSTSQQNTVYTSFQHDCHRTDAFCDLIDHGIPE